MATRMPTRMPARLPVARASRPAVRRGCWGWTA